MEKEKNRTIIQSVKKVMSVLDLFSDEESHLTLDDITKKTGFTKTTVFRYCNTLEDLNYIEKVYIGNTPYYILGMELFVIGSKAIQTLSLPEITKPYLKQLTHLSNENSYLFVYRNKKAYCIEKNVSQNVIQANTTYVGDSIPLHKGGAPSAILASLDVEDNKEIIEKMNHDFKESFKKKQSYYKEHGVVISRNETFQGTIAIGAPVYDHEGNTVGAISLGGIESRFTDDLILEWTELLKNTANEISFKLGWKRV